MTSDQDLVTSIADRAVEDQLRIVTPESLTSGSIATRLGAGPNAADWFGGWLIASREPVKFAPGRGRRACRERSLRPADGPRCHAPVRGRCRRVGHRGGGPELSEASLQAPCS